jgi:7-cyano-7-deazaguanine reductase
MLEKIKLDCEVDFIKFTYKELSATCPVNGQTDYYNLVIEFSPDSYTLEVSTLHQYLLNFRNKKILAENLASEMCKKLYNTLKPYYLSVRLHNRSESSIGIEVFHQLGWEKKL